MSLPPGVINLTAGGGQPRPQAGPKVPPPPPAHGGPPAGRPLMKQQARPPMGGPAMPGPPMPGPPMPGPPMPGPPMARPPMARPPVDPRHPAPMPPPQQMAVPPPQEAIPPELLRTRPLVEHSDLRDERMTEADARETLSEYVVYRLEKVSDPHEVDEEGYPVRPTWENIRRIEVRDLSRTDIIRRIRELNAEGKTALQRKTDLTPNQQLQIEKAQAALEAHNLDKRFHYTLQQISPKMKKIHKESIQYQQYMANREAKRVVVAKGKSSASKERKSKKNLIETVALMVYFKKEPRLEENARAILNGKRHEEAIRQRREIQARQQHEARQLLVQQQEHELFMQRERQLLQQRLHPQPPAQQLPQPPPMKALKNGKPPMIHVVQNGPKKGQTKTYALSASSSRSSRSSESSDSSRSDTEHTPDSSITGSSESTRPGRRRHRSRGHSRSRSRSRSRRRYHGRPEEYGIGIPIPRHHTKHDQHYILETDLPRERLVHVPTSPAALPRAGFREFVEDDAFLPRRIPRGAERFALEDAEEPLPLSNIGLRRRSALPARVIQGDLRFRAVGPQEVARQRHEDDLHNLRRLNIEDEVQFEGRRRHEEEWAAEREEFDSRTRRQMERRFRRPSPDRRGLFQQVPAETYEQEAARDYMRNGRDRPARHPLDNPFASLGRGARRNSFGAAEY